MKKSKLLIPLAGVAALGTIAPIAVMTTSCSKGVSATETDKAFLTTINDYMQYGEDYVAPQKAIAALKDIGYDVINYKLSNNALEFAFDASAKKFIIMNGDTVAACPANYTITNTQSVFKFTNKYDKNSKYGQYLLDNYEWTDPTAQFNVSTSVDFGNNTHIKNINYSSPTTNSREILLNTHCEYLNIADNNDTIYHMGDSNNINVYGRSATVKCNYVEVGKVAYLYVKNTTLQIARTNGTVDAAQIDVLEADTGVSKGKLFHPEYVTLRTGVKDIEGFSEVKYIKATVVMDAQELSEAILGTTDAFIRLGDNITIDDTGITTDTPIAVKDRTFVLDLAGKTLTDGVTRISKGKALFDILAVDDNSSIMFIDSWRQGQLVLNDHYINVRGNADVDAGYTGHKTAALYLEGANIKYTATHLSGTKSNRHGAIEVGVDIRTGQEGYGPYTVGQYSRVYMFGGKIEANTDSTVHKTEVSGITANACSYVQILYGAIYSSTNCVRTNGALPNAYIDIVNGTFKTLSSTYGECIYLPSGKLNITGGTFEGHCCLGIRGGDTIVSGGYFHSTGTTKNMEKAEGDASGLGSEGSVINIQLCNNAKDGDVTKGEYAYGTNPSITMHNATLYSDNSYILQIFRNDSTTAINQHVEIDFFGGVYYYNIEDSKSQYNGIRNAECVDSEFFRVSQNGGSWIKTK